MTHRILALLDPRTVFLITGLVYFIMPLLVWLALREQKSHSVTLWCAGGQAHALGLILVAVRTHVPDWVSYELALIGLYAGNVLRVQALLNELHRPLSPYWLVSLTLALFTVYETGRLVSPEGSFFYLWSMISLAGLFIWMARLSRQIALRQQLSNAHWLAGAYLPLVFVMLLRVLMVLVGNEPHGPLSDDNTALAVGLVGIVSAVMGNTSFLGFFAERVSRQQMRDAEAHARREESDRLRHQITQLDRQRSMGMLAMSLAHELSQPLTNIRLIADLGKFDTSPAQRGNSDFTRYFEDIQRNADNAIEIMQRIRSFLKSSELQRQRLDLREVIQNVDRLMHDWLRSEKIRLNLTMPQYPVPVQGDSVQIAQILVNLLRNSGQATAGQPLRELNICLRIEERNALIEVHDNGPGFSREALENIANAFYTTKAEGLGVGLSISRQIAEHHGGSLQLDNGLDGGALVALRLPVS